MTESSKDIEILFKALGGSKLYSTDLADSDEDFVGVFEYLEEELDPRPKTVKIKNCLYIEVREFARRLLNGDIAAHEALWTPFEYVKLSTSKFDNFKKWKNELISRRTIETWISQVDELYARSVKIGQLVVEPLTIVDFLTYLSVSTLGSEHITVKELLKRGKYDKVTAIRNHINLAHHGLEEMVKGSDIYGLYEDYGSSLYGKGITDGVIKSDELVVHPEGTISANAKTHCRGIIIYDRKGHEEYRELRKLAVEHVASGYSTKSMYHAFRILDSVTYLLKYDRIPIQCTSLDLVMRIRRGEVQLNELSKKYEEQIEIIRNILKTKNLPEITSTTLLRGIIFQIKGKKVETVEA